ncbi:hypothetical protein PO184_15845, partial [Bacteroides ovatus]|nr:hypothetical protein [Bacteroides ovatus]
MQVLCSLVDGDKQNGIERTNLDVKYLRGERDAKTLTSGKYVTANSLLILVDGENSGEVFRDIPKIIKFKATNSLRVSCLFCIFK